ncbi:MAG: nucleotidyltransferase family protein [Chloroflexi bacterium]|nr:nucleotidyltransferase family protein [Chloroflexota bacterium]
MDSQPALNTLLEKIKEVYPQIEKKYHINSLEVFGSFLRGEEKEGSDLDLLITFSETPGLFGFVALENYLSDTVGVKVDLVMKDSLKPNIGERILAEAQPI